MGWKETVFGAVNGAVASAVRPTLESLCDELGWKRYGEIGEGRYLLQLPGPHGPWEVFINWGRWIAAFSLRSAAELTADQLFPELGYGLLLRNKDKALVAWDMRETDDGRIGFAACYTALVKGLDPAAFKLICEGLCEEVAVVDGSLRKKGLI